VIGVHAGSPGVAEWHAENALSLNLPRLYALGDVIAAFTGAGFEAAAARLKIGFVPLSGHAPSFPAGLEYFYEHKVMLRLRAQGDAAVRAGRRPVIDRSQRA
jgi:hypothetical protein